MTNYYEFHKHVLIYGTLIEPNKIQFVRENKICTMTLDFSKLYERGAGSETAYYDVVVTGVRKKSTIEVEEIIDSPEETGISVYRLGDHNAIRWAFVTNQDFKDGVENVNAVKKNLQLMNENSVLNLEGFGKTSMITTVAEYYDCRYPRFFVCNEKNITVSGSEIKRLKFSSFQFGIDSLF